MTSSEARLDPALIRLAIIVLFGAVVAQLDLTMVNVGIDVMARDLHASLGTIQWVSTGYLLAYAIVLPISGWATDRFGARNLWLFALSLFLLGSVLCGLAWSSGSLVAFRVVQGLGGGLLIPLMTTILARAAGPQRMMRLMAIVAVPAMLAPILGPVIGGVLVDQASWRWIFLVNVPICLLGLVLAWRELPVVLRERHDALDGLGLALLSPGLAVLLYGCSRASTHGGFGETTVLVCLAIGSALLAAFTVHVLRRRQAPLIDLRLFRSGPFTGSAALMFLFGFTLFGAMLLLPLYYQQVRGASALEAGLMLAPQGAGTMLALVLVGRNVERVGARTAVLIGVGLTIVGTVPFALVDAHTSDVLLAAALFVRGAGLGAALVPVLGTSYHGLRQEQYAGATTAVRIFQQIGGSIGTALLVVILQHQTTAHAPGIDGLAAAFGDAFAWTLGLSVLAFLPALLLPGRERAATGAVAPAAAAPEGR